MINHKKNYIKTIVALLFALMFTLSACSFLEEKPNQSQTSGNLLAPVNIVINSVIEGEKLSNGQTYEKLSPVEIVEKVAPSVVFIANYNSGNLQGTGSGILISQQGYILTNEHVINGADELAVLFSNNKAFSAQIVGKDAYSDLAIIKVEESVVLENEYQIAELGDSDQMKVGNFVVAIGYPAGWSDSATATFGYVSALNREIDTTAGYTIKCIQTDAAINPGNSGGALVNEFGQVIGINSAKIVAEGYESLGFAITQQAATPIIEQLIENGKVSGRVTLGVSVLGGTFQTSTGQTLYGLQIKAVTNGYTPNKIKVNDIITKVGASTESLVEITKIKDLTDFLKSKSPGDTIVFELYRSERVSLFETKFVLQGIFSSTLVEDNR